MKEQHATRVPTVLIGIGGIGGQIVRLVDQSLRQYDKQFVRLLVLDTNTNDLSKSQALNIPFVQTSENMTVSDYLRQNSRFQEWFPVNPLINAKNLTQGAGQIRSVSRLGALASEGAHRFDTIKQAIQDVNKNVGNTLHGMIRVMIVGSVCGGTGSGMGIQLPFLVRDLIEELAHMPRTIIRGLFLMPDIVEEVQDTDEKKSAVYVNGYAFLRELNAFNKAQMFKRGTEKLNIEHYHRIEKDFKDDPTQMSHQIPYDFLFLLEKTNVNGQNIGSFDAYVSKAAQIVRSQLFASDMTAGMFSSEDNLIVSAVNREGLNRFCGAGIAKAIYPEAENYRYCTLRFSESVLQGHWLLIDRRVALNMSQHRRQMASNPSLMPKDPQAEYIRVFDEMTDPTKFEVTAEMGALKRELTFNTVITDDKGNEITETVNHAYRLAAAIDEFVSEQFVCDELIEEANGCKMSARKLNSNSAVSYCETQLSKLRRYENTAEKRVGDLTAGAIDSIIGADDTIAGIYNDRDKYLYNVPALIGGMHPIVARYVLYFLRAALKNSVEVCEAELSNLSERMTIFKKDYYKEKNPEGGKDTVAEDPSEALQRTKPGLLSVFGLKSAEYNRLVQTIVKDASAFVQYVNAKSEFTLRKEVYGTVIDRLDVLIGVYEDFFAALEQILYDNRRDRETLEEDQPRIQNSDVYVCCDADCKKWMYNKFESNLSAVEVTLPDDIKTTFFTSVFGEYVKRNKVKTDPTAFVDHPLSMRELFEISIMQPLTAKYADKEMSHVKMDIIAALKLEYQIHSKCGTLRVNGTPVDPVDYDFEQYFAANAKQLRELSTPYLAYRTLSEEENNLLVPNADVADIAADPADPSAAVISPQAGRVLCYWGVNNGAAANYQHKEQAENVDRSWLTAMFGSADGATYFAVNDDSFDPKELTCYSSVYDFNIENLSKYGKNSRAFREYNARILRVIKADFNVGTGASAYLNTVHPHLDRHWHAHAYLPMLNISEEVEEKKRIAKAFLLSVACSRVWYMPLDYTSCWAFRQTGQKAPKPLTIGGEPALRSSFHTLFLAMDENTVAVNDILRQAEADETKAYNAVRGGGVNSADLLKQPVIAGLIGGRYTEAETADLEKLFAEAYSAGVGNQAARGPLNILQVIYAVYKDAYDVDLVTHLIDNLTEYLHDYCLKMVNGQKGAAGLLFNDAAKAIGANFNAAGADIQFRMLCEDYL